MSHAPPALPDTRELLKGLNPEQKKAVTHGRGPLLIIAGAGTGKTKVITHRIAYLIASKLAQPDEILAVTFTEKAANEMEERVDRLIPYGYSFVDISTFNSFGEKVLRNYALDLGYPPGFPAAGRRRTGHLFPGEPLPPAPPLLPSAQLAHPPHPGTAGRREEAEAGGHQPAGVPEVCPRRRSGRPRRRGGRESWRSSTWRWREVYQAYEELLKKEGKIDFEDQVRLVGRLFRKRPSVLREFQEKYKYILVDEFQDTNYIQFELLKLLAARHRNLTVVGDDDQSIFRFRGASLSNILNFEKVYPKAKKIVLTTQLPVRPAHPGLGLYAHPAEQPQPAGIPGARWTRSCSPRLPRPGKSIHLLQFDTLSHEADRVAEIIREKWKEGTELGEMAILVRRNADADPFLRALNMKQVPYPVLREPRPLRPGGGQEHRRPSSRP